ncbi:MAG: glycosyltransferase family 4 protein [Gemmatimonadetes bacterium]|nr:glycosyltransferase family 4 protein [Gemmatimonadota bacterium]
MSDVLRDRGVALLAPRSAVLGYDPCGGSEVVLWEDARALQAAGVAVRVYAHGAANGASVITIPVRTRARLVTSLEYCGRFVRRERHAVLLAYNEPSVAGLAPDRTVVRFDWATALPRYWSWPAWRGRFGRATYLFPSASQREVLLADHPGFPAASAVVLANAVDLDFFRPSARPDGRPVRIGFTGQWSPEKGLGVLLDAWVKLGTEFRDAELWIAGGPLLWKRDGVAPGAEELGARVAAVSQQDTRVRVAGELPRQEMPGFWNAVDVAVVPSLRESFGLQALEAMACGVPVVASAAGGLREVVRDGECGLLIEPGDPAALVEALGGIMRNPELRIRLGQAARRRAEHYSLMPRAAKLLRLLGHVAEGARRP